MAWGGLEWVRIYEHNQPAGIRCRRLSGTRSKTRGLSHKHIHINTYKTGWPKPPHPCRELLIHKEEEEED